MKKILIIRLSAIGDVALWLPVIKRALLLNSNIEITMLTKPNTAFIFENIPRLQVISIDTKQDYKGFLGLLKFANKINSKYSFDVLVDGHDVIRTKILKKILHAKQKFTFIKGRKEKQDFINKKNNNSLIQTTTRYATVLQQAGLNIDEQFTYPNIIINNADNLIAKEFINTLNNNTIIGIAPFANHIGKILPLKKMEIIIENLLKHNYTIILFGAGANEEKVMKEWELKFSNVYTTIKFSFAQQIAMMPYCNKILTMDSANMHLASMQNVPIYSIWGATDKSLGFAPLNNNTKNIFEIKKEILPCRPCSVYGNKPCHLKNTPYACLNLIDEKVIVEKLIQL